MRDSRLDTCTGCKHAQAVHDEIGCRVTDCACSGFEAKPAPGPTGRRVAVDVPAGYTVVVTLTPPEAEVVGS